MYLYLFNDHVPPDWHRRLGGVGHLQLLFAAVEVVHAVRNDRQQEHRRAIREHLGCADMQAGRQAGRQAGKEGNSGQSVIYIVRRRAWHGMACDTTQGKRHAGSENKRNEAREAREGLVGC